MIQKEVLEKDKRTEMKRKILQGPKRPIKTHPARRFNKPWQDGIFYVFTIMRPYFVKELPYKSLANMRVFIFGPFADCPKVHENRILAGERVRGKRI